MAYTLASHAVPQWRFAAPSTAYSLPASPPSPSVASRVVEASRELPGRQDKSRSPTLHERLPGPMINWLKSMTTVDDDSPQFRNPDKTVRRTFEVLSAKWKAERGTSSSPVELARHPAYQQILRMGPTVVPLLLKELAEKPPEHWFIALKMITGADPVPVRSRGRMKEMAAAWVNWGRSRGVQW